MNESTDSNKKYWFPAKRYGWGWSFPCAWQGWVVLLIYINLSIVGGILLGRHTGIFVAYMVGISSVFFLIAYLKGEPPKWRWGDK
jgi:hypothetical protein